MNNTVSSRYFLAANSSEGFVSEFKNCYLSDWTSYIIKGGAGTGKSTLMRRFAEKAQANGIKTELCLCSSDPDSLDAVILPEKKTVILDGTAPHTVEPEFPGVCEQIINTGACWDSEKLKARRKEILSVMKENKAYHKKTSAYIMAAGQLKRFNYSHSLAATDIESCFNFALRIARHYIKEKGEAAQEWVRFLGGVTPKGYITFTDTIEHEAESVIVLKDEFGASASIILSAIRDFALSENHEIIVIKNPVLPSEITDAIIIPKLQLAFAREEYQAIESTTKKHNVYRFYNSEYLGNIKEKMKFNKKAYNSLLCAAAETLSLAKTSHDKLEEYYINAMDYAALNKLFENFLKKAL